MDMLSHPGQFQQAKETHGDPLDALFVYGVSHDRAALSARESCAVAAAGRTEAAERALAAGGHAGQVVLSTCNRTEIYGVARGVAPDPSRVFAAWAGDASAFDRHGFFLLGADAAAHLFAVASGLESMVLGETEIAGQVKQAYEEARAAGRTESLLNRLFQAAARASKAVRSGTGIGGGAASVGAVCARHALDVVAGRPEGLRLLVIGAGDMAETCARHLHKNGFRHLVVANRSLENAGRIAAAFGGRATGLDDLAAEVAEADVVVSSTSCPHAVLTVPVVSAAVAARAGRPLVLIDLALPRDIDPAVDALPGVYRHDLDHLSEAARRQQERRRDDLGAARRLVDLHVNALRTVLRAHANRPHPGKGDAVSTHAA